MPLIHRKPRAPKDESIPAAIARYEKYRLWCERVLGVYPASFEIWKQIEPWLIERGRFAVLDDLCYDRRALKEVPTAIDQVMHEDELVIA